MDTLEGLFKWSHDWPLLDLSGEIFLKDGKEVRVYQRVIGDAELQLARETALRASAMQRRKLEEDTSLDRASLVPNYMYMDIGEITALIILLELPDLRRRADRDLIFPYPEALSSEATLEEQEQYTEEIDTYFDRRELSVREAVDKLIVKRKAELAPLTKKDLRILHENAAIESACRDVFLSVMNEFMTYRGTFLDAEYTKRAYPSFNSFRNSIAYIKRQLINKYSDLELKGDQLKKSPEAS